MSDKTTYSFEDLLSQVQVSQISVCHDLHVPEAGTKPAKAVSRMALAPLMCQTAVHSMHAQCSSASLLSYAESCAFIALYHQPYVLAASRKVSFSYSMQQTLLDTWCFCDNLHCSCPASHCAWLHCSTHCVDEQVRPPVSRAHARISMVLLHVALLQQHQCGRDGQGRA